MTVNGTGAINGASKTPIRVFSLEFSGTGLVAALAFFALSLSPSLVPRGGFFQGFVSGVTIFIGYGIGVAAQWLWEYLELPKPYGRTRRILVASLLGVIGVGTAVAVWQHVGWQNDVRSNFGMESIGVLVWVEILIATTLFASLLLVIRRSIRRLFRFLASWLNRRLPRRLSRVLSGFALVILLLFLLNGLLVRGLFAFANASFSVTDGGTPAGVEQPLSPLRSGSPASLVLWDSLGQWGRGFVGTGPTVDELRAFHGDGAVEPIRVYVGQGSADSLQQRADLVLEELKRTGAFDREVLLMATTTGTGWLDPNAMDTLEYAVGGNSAIVGVQYSFFPSWLSLLADQAVVKETSRVVFDTVHAHWSTLPENDRPRIYVFGLSLGSYGAESILTSIDIVNSPIDGALFAGPPFLNELRNEVVADRDEGSPAWLPIYEEGRTVRFTGREDALGVPQGEWGRTKIVYLQHASDPVTFFSPSLAFRHPEWLQEGQRGPDVSEKMNWIPVVTMWQVAADVGAASLVPEGFGHLYGPSEYLNAWIALIQPGGWDAGDSDRLVGYLHEANASG
jgi:uncharacterized membrane protein